MGVLKEKKLNNCVFRRFVNSAMLSKIKLRQMTADVIKDIGSILDSLNLNDLEEIKGIEIIISDIDFSASSFIQSIDEVIKIVSFLKSDKAKLLTISEDQLNILIDNLVKLQYQLNTINSDKNNSLSKNKNLKFASLKSLRTIFSNIIEMARASNIYSMVIFPEYINKKDEYLTQTQEKLDNLLGLAMTKNEILNDGVGNKVAKEMSSEFEIRAKEIKNSVDWWLNAIFILLAGFIVVTLIFVIETDEISENEIMIYLLKKAFIFLPIIYVLIFSIRQYGKERRLYEVYMHKRAVASSLRAYTSQASTNSDKADEILVRGASMIFLLPDSSESKQGNSDSISVNSVRDISELVKSLKP